MEELRAKSAAAEALIEELMEENEELKKDMRLMVDEMDELQDNFRSVKKFKVIFYLMMKLIGYSGKTRLTSIGI